MEIKYGGNIEETAIDLELKKLTNLIYKLLPTYEEGEDWKKILGTLQEEIVGMLDLLFLQQDLLFPLICKLEGLYSLEDDFMRYRGTIFECLGIMGELRKRCQD